MTTSLIVLQGARDRLCSEPLGKKYNPQNFCDAMRAYLQALCESPKGESLLTEYGEYIRRNTALVTQYALARQQGLAHVSEILPVLKSVDKHTAASEFSPAAILHREALQDTRTLRKKRALQKKRTLVSYLPELKDEFNNVENVRSLLRDRRGDVVDALARGPKVDDADSNKEAQQNEPGQNVVREKEAEQKEAEQNIDRIQNALDAWWSEANSLICSAENCHADGCRILLQMQRFKWHAGETAVIDDKALGAKVAEDIKAAAKFLTNQLYFDPVVPEKTETFGGTSSTTETAGLAIEEDDRKCDGDPIVMNVLKKVGETWTIGYEGEIQPGISHKKSFDDVHHLLKHQKESISIVDLPGNQDSQIATGSVEAATKADGANLLDQINRLNADLEQENDVLVKRETEQEIADLRKQYNQNFDNRGQPRRLTGDLDKIIDATKKRFERLLEVIEKHTPTLAKHLVKHVTLGAECTYDPESHVKWDLGD